jgi:hypothetical protein
MYLSAFSTTNPPLAVPYLKSRTVTIKATRAILEANCDHFILDASVKVRELQAEKLEVKVCYNGPPYKLIGW